ncbi:MAG TPA: 16S rRNA (guanine(527)-N(7))-methyltransferase RsmG [Tissierellales bacterium]|nr:16S rRNA (guanine(527)-N(7))-methyltransferase RsmG [Tissierellales bacterium]
MYNVDTLIEGVDELNLSISNDEIEKFIIYKKLLKEWNEKINITAITRDEEIDIKHFLDSLTPLSTKLFDDSIKIIDVGTGGGFPGIPLKILENDIKLVLLDSLNKRIKFLNEVINQLNLKDVKTFHGRAEDFGKDPVYREKFDISISRAVASLNILSEYCLPFVKIGGYFIAMKGSSIDEEVDEAVNAIETLGGRIEEKQFITLPNSNIEHSLIIIKKIKPTPKKYPRMAGSPKRMPL